MSGTEQHVLVRAAIPDRGIDGIGGSGLNITLRNTRRCPQSIIDGPPR